MRDPLLRCATLDAQHPARAEFVEANCAEHRHVTRDFARQQTDGVADSRFAADRRRVGEGTTDEDEACPEN